MKIIRLTVHAMTKFGVFAAHDFPVTREDVERVVRQPESLGIGAHGRLVAQASITNTHVLRVVYEESDHELVVVTFYPGRKERYEGNV